MKKLMFLFAALLPLMPIRCLPLMATVALVGCNQVPSARVAQAQSLLAVGRIADEAVATSARLYQSGAITAVQARAVMDLYTLKFQPVYRAAAAAAQANLDSFASPELSGLAAQLLQLVATFQPKKP